MKPKIALVTFGPLRAWHSDPLPPAPPTYLDENRKWAVDALRKLGADVVVDEHVYNFDTAVAAASKIKKTDFDLLIYSCVYGWWSGAQCGGAVFHITQELPFDVPLVLWSFLTGNLQLIMFFEATKDLVSMGRTFEPVFGKDEEALEQIKVYMKVAALVSELRTTRIGQLAGFPSFIDTRHDELSLMTKLGVQIHHFHISDVEREWEKVTEEEAKKVFSEFKKYPKTCLATLPDFKEEPEVVPTDAAIMEGARLAVAIEKIVKRNGLAGYSLRSRRARGSALAIGWLADKGIPGADQGDVTSAITMTILQKLTGTPAGMFDIFAGDPKTNRLCLFHSGETAPSMAESRAAVKIGPDPHARGSPERAGASFWFPIKPGRCTLVQLDSDGSKMFIATGKVVKPSMMFTNYNEIELDSKIKDVLTTYARNGFWHHCTVVCGDWRPELEYFCKIKGIQPIIG